MKIPEKIANLFNLNISNLISSISSCYTKRVAENKYDAFMDTSWGEQLKNIPPGKKHLAEMAMYFFTGIFEQKFPENNAIFKYIKSVLSDSPPEIAKRMINGMQDDLQKLPATVERRAFLDVLCELDEDSLKNLVENLCAMDDRERKIILRTFGNLESKTLERIAKMNTDDFQSFSVVLRGEKSFWEKEAESLKKALHNYVNPKKEESK